MGHKLKERGLYSATLAARMLTKLHRVWQVGKRRSRKRINLLACL